MAPASTCGPNSTKSKRRCAGSPGKEPPERAALWSRLEKTSFLTGDEKRASIGYGPRPSAKYSPDQPRDETGRWTNTGAGGGGDGTGPFDPGASPRSVLDLSVLT